MDIDFEKMWAVDVQDEEAFLCFLFEKAPRNSYWTIELHCLQADDEAFLSKLGESRNQDNTSGISIPLTEIIRAKLISKVPYIGGIIHHRIDVNGCPLMISYDSFSACWISKAIPQLTPDITEHENIFLIIE